MNVVLCKGQFMGPISGADETVVTYATQLKAAGHSPSVLLMYPHSRDDQYYVRLRRAGVPVSSIASSPVSTSLGLGRKLTSSLFRAFPLSQHLVSENARKIASGITSRYFNLCREYFEQSQADLIHVVTPDHSAMVMIRACHAAGKPVIYQELGIPYHPPAFKAHYERFTAVLPLCSEVAALSPRLAQQCREELPPSNSLSVLPIMAEDLLNGYTPYRPTSKGVTFGFAARIERLKGPIVLVEAFAVAHHMFADMRLKIAGVGSQQRKAVSRAKALGIAHCCDFTGVYTDEEQKSAFMQNLDALVLPSLTEGTPNGIVEAMAHGLPVIASAVGGIPDMITAETGLLVPPGDSAALAGAMMRLAADPELRARMGRAARDRYEKFFSPTAVLPIMLDTYKRITVRNGEHDTVAVLNGNNRMHPWEGVMEYQGISS